MNTADKSIALIDIALRRRFEFVGYFPDYSKLEESDGVFLKHINKEIYSRKKSADYLIGHAYFMTGLDTFKIIKNKIIPLIMEYFSGKTEVVEEIFKNSSWSIKYDIEKYDWIIQPIS
jgi:5-methylcytosine-specific restriction protein B